MNTALTHWKTTVNGILAFLITTLTVFSGFLGTIDVTSSGPSVSSIHVSTWVSVGVTLALALCRAWVGLLQQDAGQTPAIPAGGGPVTLVPSHEIPNDPKATPILKS
jgi:hypothetical protein